MATNYTNLLGFALPTTGELAGTWGQVVNDSITELVEDSIAGTASVNVTSGDITLTTTGSGAANEARCAVIRVTGTPGTARNVIAPSQSKAYIVINQSDSNVTFKGAATSGHLLKPGEANLLAWNGSDYIDIEQGDVSGPASATDNAVVRFDGTSGKLIQNSAVTIADTTGDIETSGKISVGDGSASLPSITNTGDTNTGIYFPAENQVGIATNGSLAVTVDADGDVGIGTATPSYSLSVERSASSVIGQNIRNVNTGSGAYAGIYFGGATSATDAFIGFVGDSNTAFGGARSALFGTNASTPVVFTTGGTEKMRIDSSGNAIVGGTAALASAANRGNITINGASTSILALGTGGVLKSYFYSDGTNLTINNGPAGSIVFENNGAAELTITSAGFTQPVAYADTVSARGNTGTALTLDLRTANVFTATLTGNCTFTLSNPIATGASSFTLILTNDGTAGRTVAWAGGSFNFPGGAASLSRTTTANATDIWAFFTPNGGSTWYGNIVMKDVKA